MSTAWPLADETVRLLRSPWYGDSMEDTGERQPPDRDRHYPRAGIDDEEATLVRDRSAADDAPTPIEMIDLEPDPEPELEPDFEPDLDPGPPPPIPSGPWLHVVKPPPRRVDLEPPPRAAPPPSRPVLVPLPPPSAPRAASL